MPQVVARSSSLNTTLVYPASRARLTSGYRRRRLSRLLRNRATVDWRSYQGRCARCSRLINLEQLVRWNLTGIARPCLNSRRRGSTRSPDGGRDSRALAAPDLANRSSRTVGFLLLVDAPWDVEHGSDQSTSSTRWLPTVDSSNAEC